jgi:UDP-N-acetylglucosamine--N-acetylmuramyl-(pentapeptide) pyrophosphoryl-undecaprenol N-acetylglucosamine transferase
MKMMSQHPSALALQTGGTRLATQPDVHNRTIVLTGGGTGGHITPILAVAHELKRQDPSLRTIYIGERHGKFKELTASHEAIDETYEIWAGKFRRYHGESWLKRLVDIRTNLLNIRDVFLFGIGTIQSWFLLKKLKPTTVFLKGGFVGVPVGLAAAMQKRQFVTHDSDALPGLANRIVSRWAQTHAVALNPDMYQYPKSKTVQVGVLVEPHFKLVTAGDQTHMKEKLKIPPSATLLLVTGGSSGATNINKAIKQIAPQLLDRYTDLYIVHQAGKGKAGIYDGYSHERLTVIEFMRPMYVYTGAADIVVARASGNTLAELGTQAKAVIVAPNPLLTGGHQLKNADALQAVDAALVVPETARNTDSEALHAAISELMDNPTRRQELASNLHKVTLTDAAEKLAKLLLI